MVKILMSPRVSLRDKERVSPTPLSSSEQTSPPPRPAKDFPTSSPMALELVGGILHAVQAVYEQSKELCENDETAKRLLQRLLVFEPQLRELQDQGGGYGKDVALQNLMAMVKNVESFMSEFFPFKTTLFGRGWAAGKRLAMAGRIKEDFETLSTQIDSAVSDLGIAGNSETHAVLTNMAAEQLARHELLCHKIDDALLKRGDDLNMTAENIADLVAEHLTLDEGKKGAVRREVADSLRLLGEQVEQGFAGQVTSPQRVDGGVGTFHGRVRRPAMVGLDQAQRSYRRSAN